MYPRSVQTSSPVLFPTYFSPPRVFVLDVGPGGAGGSSVVSPRDQRSDRTDATESEMEGSSMDKAAPGVHRSSNGGSEMEGGAESVKDSREEGDTVENDDEEEDEETTCPFCLFQRRGPCGTQFRSWEK